MEHRHCARRHWTILVVQSLPSFLCLCNIYDFCVSFWYSKVFLLYHCWLNMAKVSHNYPFWTIFGVAKHIAKNYTLGLPLAYNFGNEKSLLLWVFVWCIKLKHEPYWEIEDPKMEVVYHIKLYMWGSNENSYSGRSLAGGLNQSKNFAGLIYFFYQVSPQT